MPACRSARTDPHCRCPAPAQPRRSAAHRTRRRSHTKSHAAADDARAVRPAQRSESVDYMQLRVLPAVRAVHTRDYLEKLRATCEELARPKPGPRRPVTLQRNLSGIAGDTYASRNSLSAALCGVLAACKAIDAVVNGTATNAFCAIR